MKGKKALIPAAGPGTRMLPHTKSIPKDMPPPVARPLIPSNVGDLSAPGL